MLTCLTMLRGLNLWTRKPLTALWLMLIGGLASNACLKSLDESLLDANAGAGGDAGAGGSAASAGSGGSGGNATGGADAGQDAAADASSDATADADASVEISVTPWDSGAFPSTNITGGAAGALISVDGSHVYFAEEAALAQLIKRRALAGGGNEPVSGSTVDNVSALLAPAGNLFLYAGVGIAATQDGQLVRFEKAPSPTNPPVAVPYASKIGKISGMTVLQDPTKPRLVVVAKTSTAGQPHVLAANLAGGASALELVYTDPDGNQTGGPIAVDKNCVYWLSNGRAFAVSLAGGTRVSALTSQISDATGLTKDASHIYVARANGEIWQRKAFGSACDGAGPPETRVLEGFPGASELVSYADRIAFLASSSALGEGGVFSHALGSATVEQAVPASEMPERLEHSGTSLIYRTSAGIIKQAPDGRQ